MNDDANRTLADSQPVAPSRMGPARPSLVELTGGDFGRRYIIQSNACFIGRSSECEVHLQDARASRRHAVIETVLLGDSTEAEFRLRDLDSRNGTFVNGQRITAIHLNEGDRIQIGHAILKFGLKDTVEIEFESNMLRMATTDPLTGLYTRDYLFREFGTLVRHCLRYNRPMTVMMVDLDDFKAVNDTHGHMAGDRVLEAATRLLTATLREDDIIGRYGGEEFLALLPETDLAAARFPAERYLTLLSRHAVSIPDGPDLSVTASIGLASLPQHGRDEVTLVASADRALYAAKAAGKNCVMDAAPLDEDEKTALPEPDPASQRKSDDEPE